MSASEKELEKRLIEARKSFLHSPQTSSAEKLLPLLDKLFICLSEVEQSPPSSIQNALSPLTKVLVFERLFNHSDVDVRVAVASCITEVMRINAPDAPYDDDKMKEVLQLIVSSFEHLDDKHSLSYTKRTSILNTVSKCHVSVLMLDPVYDALRIEMFQHFLEGLRDHHPVKVFSDMENIMTHVLNESDDIPPELLAPFLHYVRKDDKVPPISRRLAEKVLTNCSNKCKTYLAEAVKSSGVSLDKYCNVVALICEGAFSALKENKVEDKQTALELSTHEQTDAPKDEICKSTVSNGALTDSLVDADSTKKQVDMNGKDEPQQLDNAINSGLDDSAIDEKAGRPVMAVTQKKKESSTKEAKPSAASATKATSEEINTCVAKVTKESGKKMASSSKAKPNVPPTKKNTSAIKATKPSEKTTSLGDNQKPVVSSRKSVLKSKTEVKQPLEKIPTNTSTKRKHSLGEEKASDLREYDENLVGSRVRVWWPFYKRYYKGEVSSFDSSTKKHSIMYEDGDHENLLLKKHKWYFVDESESSKFKQKAAEASSPEQTSNQQFKQKAAEVSNPEQTSNQQFKQKAAEASNPEQTSNQQFKQKAAEAINPEQTGAPKRRRNLSLPHEEDPAETETPAHKRARVQNCKLQKAHGEMEKKAAEGEPSRRNPKSSLELGDSQPCPIHHQLAKVKQSIVDTITTVRQFGSEVETKEQGIVDMLTSVRQFRSELDAKEQNIVDTLTSVRQFRSDIKKKEDNLEASLHEVDVLGEKISGIFKILSS